MCANLSSPHQIVSQKETTLSICTLHQRFMARAVYRLTHPNRKAIAWPDKPRQASIHAHPLSFAAEARVAYGLLHLRSEASRL